MRRLIALGCIMSAVLLSGCVSLQVGTETGPNRLEMKGLADGYVAVEPIPEYDGTILDVGLLQEKYDQWEVASLELWPLLDTGVGAAGASAAKGAGRGLTAQLRQAENAGGRELRPPVPVRSVCRWVERRKSDLGVGLNTLTWYHDSGRALRRLHIIRPGVPAKLEVAQLQRPRMRTIQSLSRSSGGRPRFTLPGPVTFSTVPFCSAPPLRGSNQRTVKSLRMSPRSRCVVPPSVRQTT